MRFESLGPGILFWLQGAGCEIIRLNDILGNGKKIYLKGPFYKNVANRCTSGLNFISKV